MTNETFDSSDLDRIANEQLDIDLQVRRGGNKARLVARAWVATNYGAECGMKAYEYDRFRFYWTRETFDKIHSAFDQFLPAEFQASYGNQSGTGTSRQAKQANGLSPAQQKKFNSFMKAAARLEKRYLKSADYFASCGSSDHLNALVKQRTDAARVCRALDSIICMSALWDSGIRSSGDLERMINKDLGI